LAVVQAVSRVATSWTLGWALRRVRRSQRVGRPSAVADLFTAPVERQGLDAMPAETTIYVVDDDPILRKALRMVLEAEGYEVRLFGAAAEFLEACSPKDSGCVLLDLRLDDMSGLEVHERLLELGVHMPIIMMSGYADVPVAVKAMRSGAIDFLQKPFQNSDLLAAVRRGVLRAQQIRRSEAGLAILEARFAKLSVREKQVLDGVLAGKVNKVIAMELSLSSKTVEYHRARMMEKLGVDSVAELVKLVLKLRLEEARKQNPMGGGGE
jgi:two-component system response regulator TtrR